MGVVDVKHTGKGLTFRARKVESKGKEGPPIAMEKPGPIGEGRWQNGMGPRRDYETSPRQSSPDQGLR